MKKIIMIFILSIIICSIYTTTAFAEIKMINLPPDENGHIVSIREAIPNLDKAANAVYGCDVSDVGWQGCSMYKDGEWVNGDLEYFNFDSSKLGLQIVNFVFTPDDPTLPKIEATEKVFVRMNIKNAIAEDDDSAVTSLAESDITMEPNTNYTPHLIDMIEGSEYTWTSSDKTVAIVNKKFGKIISKGEGTAVISCKVDTPYDDTYTLNMTVTVGSGTASRSTMRTASADNTIYLSKGDKQTLTPDYDATNSTCMFKSNKPSTVWVDWYTGEITAKKPGEAYILCTITGTDYSVRTVRYNIAVK